ncbi:S46 family peptidase [Lysobacter sp. GX 14042]|uniref:S46 family peptidase n=1 Tax=Lysobacter sp. GX 14042 TaxID=2907155 RepID=UPI001F45D532|nr:S46 family peptidase [Lysobacter sp. GX 14042]MCE7033266.1 S46 family peptidase [Lysobacter sp. GX 14042]
MWLPAQLPEIAAQLREAGFQGEPAALADLTRPPLNAVVRVGGGTGAFVSADGLLLTNHHVAFGVIQYNSTPDRDLIENGYVAATRDDELPANPDYRVRVTTGFDRVTDRVLAGARGKTGRAYHDAVEDARKALVAECEQEPGNRCSVVDVHYGADFYLVTQLELRDIRLAYAPPDAIGGYGGEIDNFMWPRHSGDFTLLRTYVGPDGRPADFSPDNVPYTPPAHLQVSTAAVEEGDFAMLAGYPGRTFRHRMASEFAEQVGWQLPSRVALYGGLLDTIAERTEGQPELKVRYAATVASLENNLKRARGELEGLQRSDAVEVRAADEAAMLDWLRSRGDAEATLADIDAVRAVLAEASATRERDQLVATLGRTEVFDAALRLQRLALERGKPDARRESGYQLRDEPLIRAGLERVQRRYAEPVEKALLASLVRQYLALPADQHLPEFDRVFGTDPAALDQRIDALYAGTTLDQAQARLDWLQADPAALAAADDSLLRAAATLLPALLRIEDEAKAREGELLRLRPSYMRTLVGYRHSQDRAVYPDANSTLRVSYGRVSTLRPRDGVLYQPLTTVAGIVEKHTGQAPFDAPERLLEAIAAGDFGNTADAALGTQTVNLMTNLDTTGGNSGSPVLDAEGRIIGLNFDSNWESVSASWMYDPRYKRAIHVDMRYMRWLMDKVYPAHHLLGEMALPVD